MCVCVQVSVIYMHVKKYRIIQIQNHAYVHAYIYNIIIIMSMSLETPFPRLPGRSSCPWAPHPRRLHPKLDLEGTCCRPFQKLPLLVVPEKHHEHFNIAMEHGPFIDDFPIKASIYKGFSTAMSNNQRVGWWTESWEKNAKKACWWSEFWKNESPPIGLNQWNCYWNLFHV